MADDKGGGGSEWGPLEIIIGIVVAIALLNRLSGNPTSPFKNTSQSTDTVVEQQNSSTCGLSIVRPKPLEKVKDFVTIGGTVGSCDWKTKDTVALYAQLVDRKGVPVSSYVAVTPSQIDGDTVSFMQTIDIVGNPTSGTGYLILIPAVETGSTTSLSYRVPITFSK